MNRRILLSILCATILGPSAAVRGQITGTTGAAVVVANPPSNVSENIWENDTEIRAFAEKQNFVLPQAVTADITVAGTYSGMGNTTMTTGVIAMGTTVNVYTIHFDVLGARATNDPLEGIGSFTFGTSILGLLPLNPSQGATNALLGLPGVTYSDDTFHGLEVFPNPDPTSDTLTLSADYRTISLDLHDAGLADDMRVITSVPESSTLYVFVALLAILPFGRVRQKANLVPRRSAVTALVLSRTVNQYSPVRG